MKLVMHSALIGTMSHPSKLLLVVTASTSQAAARAVLHDTPASMVKKRGNATEETAERHTDFLLQYQFIQPHRGRNRPHSDVLASASGWMLYNYHPRQYQMRGVPRGTLCTAEKDTSSDLK